jgi:hypothetical protein
LTIDTIDESESCEKNFKKLVVLFDKRWENNPFDYVYRLSSSRAGSLLRVPLVRGVVRGTGFFFCYVLLFANVNLPVPYNFTHFFIVVGSLFSFSFELRKYAFSFCRGHFQ